MTPVAVRFEQIKIQGCLAGNLGIELLKQSGSNEVSMDVSCTKRNEGEKKNVLAKWECITVCKKRSPFRPRDLEDPYYPWILPRYLSRYNRYSIMMSFMRLDSMLRMDCGPASLPAHFGPDLDVSSFPFQITWAPAPFRRPSYPY